MASIHDLSNQDKAKIAKLIKELVEAKNEKSVVEKNENLMKTKNIQLLKQNKKIAQQTAKMKAKFGQVMKVCKNYQVKYVEACQNKLSLQQKMEKVKRHYKNLAHEYEKEKEKRKVVEVEKDKLKEDMRKPAPVLEAVSNEVDHVVQRTNAKLNSTFSLQPTPIHQQPINLNINNPQPPLLATNFCPQLQQQHPILNLPPPLSLNLLQTQNNIPHFPPPSYPHSNHQYHQTTFLNQQQQPSSYHQPNHVSTFVPPQSNSHQNITENSRAPIPVTPLHTSFIQNYNPPPSQILLTAAPAFTQPHLNNSSSVFPNHHNLSSHDSEIPRPRSPPLSTSRLKSKGIQTSPNLIVNENKSRKSLPLHNSSPSNPYLKSPPRCNADKQKYPNTLSLSSSFHRYNAPTDISIQGSLLTPDYLNQQSVTTDHSTINIQNVADLSRSWQDDLPCTFSNLQQKSQSFLPPRSSPLIPPTITTTAKPKVSAEQLTTTRHENLKNHHNHYVRNSKSLIFHQHKKELVPQVQKDTTIQPSERGTDSLLSSCLRRSTSPLPQQNQMLFHQNGELEEDNDDEYTSSSFYDIQSPRYQHAMNANDMNHNEPNKNPNLKQCENLIDENRLQRLRKLMQLQSKINEEKHVDAKITPKIPNPFQQNKIKKHLEHIKVDHQDSESTAESEKNVTWSKKLVFLNHNNYRKTKENHFHSPILQKHNNHNHNKKIVRRRKKKNKEILSPTTKMLLSPNISEKEIEVSKISVENFKPRKRGSKKQLKFENKTLPRRSVALTKNNQPGVIANKKRKKMTKKKNKNIQTKGRKKNKSRENRSNKKRHNDDGEKINPYNQSSIRGHYYQQYHSSRPRSQVFYQEEEEDYCKNSLRKNHIYEKNNFENPNHDYSEASFDTEQMIQTFKQIQQQKGQHHLPKNAQDADLFETLSFLGEV